VLKTKFQTLGTIVVNGMIMTMVKRDMRKVHRLIDVNAVRLGD
jgi:hypothetical protein